MANTLKQLTLTWSFWIRLRATWTSSSTLKFWSSPLTAACFLPRQTRQFGALRIWWRLQTLC
jgi:hypothetical protein